MDALRVNPGHMPILPFMHKLIPDRDADFLHGTDENNLIFEAGQAHNAR